MPRPKKKRDAALANGDANKPRPILGVTLELNNKEVLISTENIDPSKGFEFGLTEPVPLGSPGDFLDWISKTFNIKPSLKDTLNPDKLPDPIKKLLDEIINAEITVVKAHIKVPPKGTDAAANTKYTLKFSATMHDGIDLIPNVLKLKGGVLGVTNEKAAEETE